MEEEGCQDGAAHELPPLPHCRPLLDLSTQVLREPEHHVPPSKADLCQWSTSDLEKQVLYQPFVK